MVDNSTLNPILFSMTQIPHGMSGRKHIHGTLCKPAGQDEQLTLAAAPRDSPVYCGSDEVSLGGLSLQG